MNTLWQDIRYAARTLAKSPGFTLVVMLTLGLGIGANSAVFSVVNAFLLRPLPVKAPEGLVVLAVKHDGNLEAHGPSFLDYVDYQKQSNVFSEMSGVFVEFAGLASEGRADRVIVEYVTPGYFQMLGVEAAVGRVLLPSEGETPGADPVVVLGHSFWLKRFGGDRGVVGRQVRLNGQSFTVVGVAPEYFRGTYTIADFDAYLPMGMAASDPRRMENFTRRDNHGLRTLARLKPGVTLAQAQAAMDVIGKRLEAQYPDTNKTVTVHVYPERISRPEPGAAEQNPLVASVFLALTLLVLLVACVNVANLLLVRGTLRHKEMAIRAALGAGPQRLVRQLMTESLLLAGLGGAAGIGIGLWATRLLEQVRLPGDIPFHFELGMDWRIFTYVAGIAVFAGVVVGVLPALRAARADVNDALRETGRGVITGKHRARNLLVISQVAGSLVLLIASGLFLRSLGKAQSVDFGFNPHGVMNFSMNPGQQGYDEARTRTLLREIEQRVRPLPGVEAVSLAFSVPFGYYNNGEYITAEGQTVTEGKRRPSAGYNIVSPEYFRVMQIPIRRGRPFTEHDAADSARVAIVNEKLAADLWPGQDAIGKRFAMTGEKGQPGPLLEVVGIVRNGKYGGGIFDDPRAYFFLPQTQRYEAMQVLQIRASVPPDSLTQPVLREIRALDAELPVYDIMSMERGLHSGNGLFLIEMGATIAAALGGLGLMLAVVGVYGVVSFAASQRTHEIGIRMALGAEARDILRLIIGQGFRLVFIGLACGVVAALLMARAMAGLLFGLSAYDPLTFGGVALLLAAVAGVACWIPARRAARVDPLVALRYE